MLRHPLDDALRTCEEPPRAAFLTGVTRLWPGPFTSQNENMGLSELLLEHFYDVTLPPESPRNPFRKYTRSDFKRITDPDGTQFFGFVSSRKSLLANLVLLWIVLLSAYWGLPRWHL